VSAIWSKFCTTATKCWCWLEKAAEKRHINLRTFVVLYALGISVFYYGVWILATHDFFLGLAIMAGSYFFDYGYIFVFGEPDKKMLTWVTVLALVAIVSLWSKVGLVWALTILVSVAAAITVARTLRNAWSKR
jgi:hypothetical protein